MLSLSTPSVSLYPSHSDTLRLSLCLSLSHTLVNLSLSLPRFPLTRCLSLILVVLSVSHTLFSQSLTRCNSQSFTRSLSDSPPLSTPSLSHTLCPSLITAHTRCLSLSRSLPHSLSLSVSHCRTVFLPHLLSLSLVLSHPPSLYPPSCPFVSHSHSDSPYLSPSHVSVQLSRTLSLSCYPSHSFSPSHIDCLPLPH